MGFILLGRIDYWRFIFIQVFHHVKFFVTCVHSLVYVDSRNRALSSPSQIHRYEVWWRVEFCYFGHVVVAHGQLIGQFRFENLEGPKIQNRQPWTFENSNSRVLLVTTCKGCLQNINVLFLNLPDLRKSQGTKFKFTIIENL